MKINTSSIKSINKKIPKGWVKFKYGHCYACNIHPAFHRHHVHYDEPEKVVNLCITCHKKITKINKDKGWEKKSKLTKEERIDIFDVFLDSFRA